MTSDLSKFRCFQGLVLILAKFRTTFRATKNVFLPRIERERAKSGRGRSRLFLDTPEMKFKRDEKKFLISFSSATFDLRHECLETFFPCVKRNFISAHASVMSAHFKRGCWPLSSSKHYEPLEKVSRCQVLLLLSPLLVKSTN